MTYDIVEMREEKVQHSKFSLPLAKRERERERERERDREIMLDATPRNVYNVWSILHR